MHRRYQVPTKYLLKRADDADGKISKGKGEKKRERERGELQISDDNITQRRRKHVDESSTYSRNLWKSGHRSSWVPRIMSET